MANEKTIKTMIGGQALIEGILMRGPDKDAIVLRKKDGLEVNVQPRKLPPKGSVKTFPMIRGVVNFIDSQKTGINAIFQSAEDEEAEEPSKFEKWLTKKLGSDKANKLFYAFALIFALGFTVALFFLLPMLISGLLDSVVESTLLLNLIEGMIRIAIFVVYMVAVTRIPDMKRVYSYHGAEHKTIRCYEARLPLTVENVRVQTRLHPRCGTSFLLVVIVISILLFSVASAGLLAAVPALADMKGTFLYRLIMVAYKLLLIPVVVSLGYELNRIVGRYDNWFTRALSTPGMLFQKLTTCEPDDEMIEVAITALEAVVPEQEGADKW